MMNNSALPYIQHPIPPLPPHYLPRAVELAQLKAAVLGAGHGPFVITAAGREPAGPALPGAGRTTLAAALAREPDVQHAFPDGVLWLTLGARPSLLLRQAELARALGDECPAFLDIAAGKAALRELLEDRACLLILDDVWEIEHLEALNVVGPRGRLLFTTSDNGPLAMLGTDEVQLAPLGEEEALALLGAWTGLPVDGLPPGCIPSAAAGALVQACGGLPLLLALLGGLLREHAQRPELWDEALRLLDAVAVEKLARRFPDFPHPDLLRAVEVSVGTLPPEVRARYLDLAVFPAETPIPETVLHILWAPLDAADVRQLVDTLASRALVQVEGDAPRMIRMHELLRMYAQGHISNWPALHERLLDACQAALRAQFPTAPATGAAIWRVLPRDDYLWAQLPYHLVEARRHDQLWRLLLDFDWLEARLATVGFTALDALYDLLPADAQLDAVRGALRLAAPALATDRAQLVGQLWGRLADSGAPEIRAMLKQARRWQGAPYLRPLTPSLTPPGGPLRHTLTGHREPVRAVAVTPDGRRALSGAADGRLILWDLEQGKVLHTLGFRESASGHHRAINRLAILPDGRRALSAGEDGVLRLWDLEAGTEPGMLKGHRYGVNGVAVWPAGGRAISASADATLRVWDVAAGPGVEVRTIQARGGPLWDVAALPDGVRAVSASADGAVRVWDAARGVELRTLTGHTGEVYAVAVTPDGRQAVSGSADQTVKVWDLERGVLLHTLKGHAGPVHAVAVTPDGEWVISASADGALKVWDLARGIEHSTLSAHRGAVLDVATTLDGRAVSASADGTLNVWDLERGAGLHTLTGHRDAVNALVLLPEDDGEPARRFVSASKDRTLKVWGLEWVRSPVRLPSFFRKIGTLEGHKGDVDALAAVGDGRRVISASRDRTLKVWDVEQGAALCTLTGHQAPVTAVVVLPDRRRAVSGSSDRTLKVWDIERGEALLTLAGHRAAITALAATPDGSGTVVSACRDGLLKVWDVERGVERYTLPGHGVPIWALAVTGDGRWVISGAADGTLRVWDLASGERTALRSLVGHRGQVTAVAVTPDGRLAVSGAEDHTVRVWHLSGGRMVACFTGESAILACAIVPDGASSGLTVLAAERSGRIHLLRLEMGE